MATASQPQLTELLLSSTSSASPLPTTSLHSLTTGASLFSFKSPNASTSTQATPSNAAGEGKDAPQLKYRKSMGLVQSQAGMGGVVVGLGGKDGRAGVNVWGFQKVSYSCRSGGKWLRRCELTLCLLNAAQEQVLQRLIPPVRLSTICISHAGLYLAGGTADGRIFFWEVRCCFSLLCCREDRQLTRPRVRRTDSSPPVPSSSPLTPTTALYQSSSFHKMTLL